MNSSALKSRDHGLVIATLNTRMLNTSRDDIFPCYARGLPRFHFCSGSQLNVFLAGFVSNMSQPSKTGDSYTLMSCVGISC